VTTEIKFCGLTRPEDATFAASVGASYAGVIFAGGPRMLTLERAKDVLAGVPADVRRVGVFADQPEDEIGEIAHSLGLTVVQLHGSSDLKRVEAVRSGFGKQVWAVVRIAGSSLPGYVNELANVSDGLLLDALVAGQLGGTGQTIPWGQLGESLADIRAKTRIILAGGLRPENVAQAIADLSPDIVDVSSGVESAPGIKDHGRMRAFRDAVTHAMIST
jgi:phosphoribosylanthranilate isomerase